MADVGLNQKHCGYGALQTFQNFLFLSNILSVSWRREREDLSEYSSKFLTFKQQAFIISTLKYILYFISAGSKYFCCSNDLQMCILAVLEINVYLLYEMGLAIQK